VFDKFQARKSSLDFLSFEVLLLDIIENILKFVILSFSVGSLAIPFSESDFEQFFQQFFLMFQSTYTLKAVFKVT